MDSNNGLSEPTRVVNLDQGASLPSTRLYIDGAEEDALTVIRDHLESLAAKGQRAWTEVVYGPSPDLSVEQAEQWKINAEETFDAVELVDGDIVTLPPYSQLVGI